MNDQIAQLDDATAQRILDTLARITMRTEHVITDLTPDQRQVLQDAFGTNEATAPVSEGDLARQALMLLAQDPERSANLQAMLDAGPPRRFEPLTIIAVATAALTILQTEIQFTKDKAGKTTFSLKKRALSDSVLTSLVQKLLRVLPPGSSHP